MLVAAGFAFKRPILEQWYLWELESEDEQERKLAAEKLGELRSVRAIPSLIRILRGEYVFPGEPNPGEPLILHYSSEALARIGAPAVPSLIEIFSDKIEAKKLKDPDDDPRVAAVFTLGKIGVAVHGLSGKVGSLSARYHKYERKCDRTSPAEGGKAGSQDQSTGSRKCRAQSETREA